MAYMLGSQESLDELFKRYNKRMFNYALRLLDNRADAEDVVGEFFYKITFNKDAYKEQAKFSTWAYTVARNLCLDRLRQRKKIVFFWTKRSNDSQDYQQWDIADDSKNPSERVEDSEVASIVKAAVNRLNGLQKEAIILREYQKLSYDQISEVLSVSKSKVKILIFRARKKLGKTLLPLIKEVQNV